MANDTIPTARLEEIRELAAKATPGPWFTCGLPWFQTGSGVLAGSADPHVGFIIADTETWEGEREEYLANQPAVKALADPDEDAAFIARLDPQTISAVVSELIERRNSSQAEIDRLREAYLAWKREEIEAVELIEAVAAVFDLHPKTPRSECLTPRYRSRASWPKPP